MARNHELPPDPNDRQDGHGMEVVEDGTSLMLCSPLIPQRDSLVEIAETEYISFNEAGRIAESHRSPLHQVHTIDGIDEESEPEDDEGKSETHRTAVGEESFQNAEGSTVGNNGGADLDGQPSDTLGGEPKSIFRWPWCKTEEEKCTEQKAREERKQAEAKAKEERKLKKKNEKLMWVPSPTKISLQTMWWGYRMSVNSSPAGSVTNWLSLSAISLHPSSRC